MRYELKKEGLYWRFIGAKVISISPQPLSTCAASCSPVTGVFTGKSSGLKAHNLAVDAKVFRQVTFNNKTGS
jgi:hypothetical protein